MSIFLKHPDYFYTFAWHKTKTKFVCIAATKFPITFIPIDLFIHF